ncbi:MAG: pantoate--beta-alanine ligase [Pseudonocardiales bacterium]|nr:MAG: pantoate--beta-alanine ligase [Pseudonocardiales bacterium]
MTAVTLASTGAELKAAQAERDPGVGLVLTMGALHEGHASLVRAARQQTATVVVSVFVNPLQFGPKEDFARYPRTLDADLELCAREGVDIVFAPSADEVYEGGREATVRPGPLGDQLEGAARPGHFAGVLTVVHKLFGMVADVDTAYFGEKDYQQLVLVAQMVADLQLAPAVVCVPTVRESDGLAMSSRNRFLGLADRAIAPVLSEALFAGVSAAEAGGGGGQVLAAAMAVLETERAVSLDYLELRSPDLMPLSTGGPARLLVAARLGLIRLIDNVGVMLPTGAVRPPVF